MKSSLYLFDYKTDKKLIYLLFLVLILSASCVPQEKLAYLQSDQELELYANESVEEITVQPGDELYIRVSSFDDIAFNFFNTQASASQMNLNNELSVSLVSFTVNDSGYVTYPIAGDLYVQDLTEEEVADELQNMLSSYFNQPTVTVKKVNKVITVLGEVRTPGHYNYTKKSLSIYEGLGLAGDITIHGNKQEVTLVREKEGDIQKWVFDLTDDSILTSPHFFLESGDVLIVKSRRTALWSVTTSTISLMLSSITTLLVLITTFTSN